MPAPGLYVLLGLVFGVSMNSVAASFPDPGQGAALEEDAISKQVVHLSDEELEDRNFYSLLDLGRFVPSMQTYVAGGGAGAGLYLRGFGATPLSAAFDSSAPIVVDGVSLLPVAILKAGQVDTSSVDVVFGPQGVTYGRGATAGTIVLTSHDPGENFEAELSGSYLPEHKGGMLRAMVSVPIGSHFGVRLAVSAREDDQLRENLVGLPSSTVDYRGRESLDGRLTLLWEPVSSFRARLKVFGSWTRSDGPNWMAQMRCPEGELQTTRVSTQGSFGTPPPTWSCLADGTIAFPDNQVLLPDPSYSTWSLWNKGVPYEEQELGIASFQVDWFINQRFSIQSISAYGALESDSMDVYDYAMGFGSSQYTHKTTGWSQELKLQSHVSDGLNIVAGALYKEMEQDYLAGQNPMSYGLSASDLYTGNAYDWDRWQFSNDQHWSAYVRLGWDMGANIHLNAGLRYSEDDRSSRITIPYINAWLQADGFPAQGTTLDEGLNFEDDEITPEVVLSWAPHSALRLYAAYRSGYKAGGVDTSKMPYPGFGQLSPDAFLFGNETADGYELGWRWTGRSRLQVGVTAHFLEYSELQLQQFNSNDLTYKTLSGAKASSEGVSLEAGWKSRSGNLNLQGSIHYVDTKFTGQFMNVEGQSLDGTRVPRTPQTSAEFNIHYRLNLGGWKVKTGLNTRYLSRYPLDEIHGTPHQQDFVLYDAFVSVASPREHYELSVAGLNLSDEIYAMSSMARPFACPSDCFSPAYPLYQFDQVVTSALGRQVAIRLTAKF